MDNLKINKKKSPLPTHPSIFKGNLGSASVPDDPTSKYKKKKKKKKKKVKKKIIASNTY